jgi:hypothetical protein
MSKCPQACADQPSFSLAHNHLNERRAAGTAQIRWYSAAVPPWHLQIKSITSIDHGNCHGPSLTTPLVSDACLAPADSSQPSIL